jgi:hypothetical protein
MGVMGPPADVGVGSSLECSFWSRRPLPSTPADAGGFGIGDGVPGIEWYPRVTVGREGGAGDGEPPSMDLGSKRRIQTL